MCLLATWVSSFAKCLCRCLTHFSTGLLVFLLLFGRSYLLDLSCLWDRWVMNIFSHSSSLKVICFGFLLLHKNRHKHSCWYAAHVYLLMPVDWKPSRVWLGSLLRASQAISRYQVEFSSGSYGENLLLNSCLLENSVSCVCRTEVPMSSLVVSWELLPHDPLHLQSQQQMPDFSHALHFWPPVSQPYFKRAHVIRLGPPFQWTQSQLMSKLSYICKTVSVPMYVIQLLDWQHNVSKVPPPLGGHWGLSILPTKYLNRLVWVGLTWEGDI